MDKMDNETKNKFDAVADLGKAHGISLMNAGGLNFNFR